MKKSKHQVKNFDQNPVEAFRDLGGAVARSFVKDLGKDIVGDLWDQLLGGQKSEKNQSSKQAGDLSEGQEIDFKQMAYEKQLRQVEPGIDYAREIIHAEKRASEKGQHEVKMQIQEILVEIKKLTKTTKELEIEFREVAIVEVPVNPGKYHLNFFEWILSTIANARKRVEDATSWLSVFKSKKDKRQYWSLFKKHGTSFGLSGERIVATQVG